MAEGHAEDPRSTPFARGALERGGPAEEIDLAFGPRSTVEDADGSPRRGDRPHEPLHRFVTGAVAVLLDEVLPDPLQAQTRVELLGDRRAVRRRGEPRARCRAGERFGRFWVRAGERFGRI